MKAKKVFDYIMSTPYNTNPKILEQLLTEATNSGTSDIEKVELDTTLTASGKAADAKAVGDALKNIDYPVDSVNGKKGDVVLTASDVGALPANTVIPSIDGLATEEYADTVAANAASDAAEAVKNDLLNGAGAAYDTLKELGVLINENTDAIEALEIIATGKADSIHSHDDIYYTKAEVDSFLSQKTLVQIITWEADD